MGDAGAQLVRPKAVVADEHHHHNYHRKRRPGGQFHCSPGKAALKHKAASFVNFHKEA
ncbi:MAG: hypothetical protein ACJ8C4_18005 [Gemmataceae bacterium]